MIAFGLKLLQMLDTSVPPRSQAWLAEESRVSTSVISRIVSGKRKPTPIVIDSLAPVLGVEPSHLVYGTDAEERYRASGDLIRKELYEVAARRLTDAQVRIADLERQLQGLSGAHSELGRVNRERDRASRDLEELRVQNKDLRADLQRYRNGLAQAVAQYATLQGQLRTLDAEFSSTKKTSRASAIWGAVGAVTGVVTVAHFITKDDSTPDSAGSPDTTRELKKRTRSRSTPTNRIAPTATSTGRASGSAG